MTTKAQALDHLTDVLAGEDVAGEPTVAGAIDKLATMIEDGEITIGGGDGDNIVIFRASGTMGQQGIAMSMEYPTADNIESVWRDVYDNRKCVILFVTLPFGTSSLLCNYVGDETTARLTAPLAFLGNNAVSETTYNIDWNKNTNTYTITRTDTTINIPQS